MKKIYVFLMLVFNIVFTSCMEEQRPTLFTEKLYSDATEIPLTEVNQKKLTMAPVLLDANQPGWQQLNAIGNMTYKKDQPIFCTPQYNTSWIKETNTFKDQAKGQSNNSLINNLNPIYRAHKNCDNNVQNKQVDSKEEQKIFLQKKINTKLTIEDVNCLFSNACNLFLRPFNYCYLTSFLNSYNKDIDKDIAGKAVYNSLHGSERYKGALFCSALKKYFLTINNSKESFPSFDDSAQWEDSSCYLINKSNNSAAQQFPAYFDLADFLQSISHCKEGSIEQLSSCFYANENIVFEGYSQEGIVSKIDLSRKLYNLAYSLVIEIGSMRDIYMLLCMIENAKKLKLIINEDDLIEIVLSYDSTDTLIGKASNWWNSEYITDTTKKRLVLLCLLIKKYNQKLNKKITPTSNQYILYDMIRNLHLALPDSLNRSIFDDNLYAFTEFKQLINEITKIMCSNNESIQAGIEALLGNETK